MPTLSPVTPVIELAFDPIVQVGDLNIRLQTLGLAVVIVVILVVAARIARRTPVDVRRSPDDAGPTSDDPNHLRRDDLLYIAVAALPGAVIGGRIGYWLLHLDYYTANPGAILDLSQGGYQLSLAVVGGTLTAAIVASLLDAPAGRWLHAMILPVLLGIAGGKAVMVLGGEGQGLPWNGPWATAYLGPGPWLSLAPEVPSHPSQIYESLATTLVLLVLAVVLARGGFRRMAGGAFLLGLALWAVARLLVAFTWRDPAVLGPLRMDQVISLAIAAGAIALLLAMQASASRGRSRAPGGSGPEWPDPATRPSI